MADNNGGAIAAAEECSVSMESTKISTNHAKQGGGIQLDSSALDFNDSEVTGNVAMESGNSIEAIESVMLFDKKTLIKGNATIDGDIRNINTKVVSIEKPPPAEAPISPETPSSVEAPASKEALFPEEEEVPSEKGIVVAEEPMSAEGPVSETAPSSFQELPWPKRPFPAKEPTSAEQALFTT